MLPSIELNLFDRPRSNLFDRPRKPNQRLRYQEFSKILKFLKFIFSGLYVRVAKFIPWIHQHVLA